MWDSVSVHLMVYKVNEMLPEQKRHFCELFIIHNKTKEKQSPVQSIA